ncbi:ABC transporter ATP-binding protein [Acuticoccus mangrovi]|uniref:ATP-binding cassette domain-containing protein n=1 Tax=Acuticoccus mangrovi TaxID=2796142 RepID=A0A934IRD7_9HYPH|nr:ATP-binding cassette domain-containing protein [Acuticoccus mangrovi]MBJ3776259.1 ATP-binding cassette domain-containing protein [Acuticoccus mangrovi]
MGLALTITDLVVEASGGRHLLSVPQLDVPAGCHLGISGPSGAGKSTFLHALAGLARRTSGHVLWDGCDILALRQGARARFRRDHMGFVFQDPLLFEEISALANAGVAAAFAPRRRRAAVTLAAGEALTTLGVPTRPARPAATHSGGERQRIALARALATDPPILLADEPTASLDRATADTLADALLGAARAAGRTLVVVSHDPALIARMDRVLTLRNGEITE